jgi:cell division transport system permease protein
MPVSVDYVARETASNLWRNRLMTIAAVLTVAVSLTLVGAALLLRQGSANASGALERGNHVTVWMNPTADKQEINAVGTQLSQLTYLHQPCAYWNKARNFAEARKLLPSDVLQATTAAEMPTSYWCTPVQLADATQLITAMRGIPGVRTVTAPLQQIHTEEKVINISKWVCLGIAVVLIVSAAVLILNTIRMAIFARRREVSVMKLVGATNWFIRVPFMLEGLVHGLVGALAAFGAAFFIRTHLSPFISTSLITNNNPYVSPHDTVLTGLAIIVVGVVVGAAGSYFAIRRFLAV